MLPNLSALQVDGRSADVAVTFPSVTNEDTSDLTKKIVDSIIQNGTMHLRLNLRYVPQTGIALSMHVLLGSSPTYKHELQQSTYNWPMTTVGITTLDALLQQASNTTPPNFSGGNISEYRASNASREQYIVITSARNHSERIFHRAKHNDTEFAHMQEADAAYKQKYYKERDEVARIMVEAMRAFTRNLNADNGLFNDVAKEILKNYYGGGEEQPRLVATLIENATCREPHPTPDISQANKGNTELATIDLKLFVAHSSDAPLWVVERYLMSGTPNEEPSEPSEMLNKRRARAGGDFEPQ